MIRRKGEGRKAKKGRKKGTGAEKRNTSQARERRKKEGAGTIPGKGPQKRQTVQTKIGEDTPGKKMTKKVLSF